MSQPRTIALDAMGGDHGPSVVVPGAALSLERYPTLSFIFYGDEARIRAELDKLPALAAKSRIVHTDIVVNMSDKPSQALRRGKGTSLWLAIEAVHKGEADVAVSAGNTGAFMAMSKLILRPMAGIERPAIAALWPTIKAECIVLDVGANIGATARAARRFRPHGRRHGARAVPHRAPDGRAAQRRCRGDQGRRGGAAGARLVKEHRAAARLSRLHRGRPDRPGRGRRGRRRRLCRQHRAEDRGRHRQADQRVPAGRHAHAPGCRGSALCWPPAASASSRKRWTPGGSTAARSLASTASRSRVTGARMPWALPAPSISAYEMAAKPAHSAACRRPGGVPPQARGDAPRAEACESAPSGHAAVGRILPAPIPVEAGSTIRSKAAQWQSFVQSSAASAPICPSAS